MPRPSDSWNWMGKKSPFKWKFAIWRRIVRRQRPLFVERGLGARECEKVWKISPGGFLFASRHRAYKTERGHCDASAAGWRICSGFAAKLQKKHQLPIACFGHAGDRNIHTNVMVDYTKPNAERRASRGVGRTFPTDRGVGWEHHRRARHWPGEEAIVAAGCFKRDSRVASRRQARRGSKWDSESREVCFEIY